MSLKPNKAPHYERGFRLADHCVARRACLGGCGKVFMSRGPGNRVCPTCAKRNAAANHSRRDG